MAFAVPAATAAGTTPTTAGTPPTTDWTVMVYMDGDQDHGDLYLGPWVTHDIDKELAVVGSNADVQVVALADRGRYPSKADGAWKGARIFHITQGMKATADNAVADWGQIDMGSPQTLIDFVNWARGAYPAKHYALFMWDHGWGWWPGNTMEDDTSNDYLDMDELRDALQTLGGVDMVGWDTCLGQTIEVEAQLRGFAKAVAGSEDSIGYSGFAYDYLLPSIAGRSVHECRQARHTRRQEHEVAPRQVDASLVGGGARQSLGRDDVRRQRPGMGTRRRATPVSCRLCGGTPARGHAAADLHREPRSL